MAILIVPVLAVGTTMNTATTEALTTTQIANSSATEWQTARAPNNQFEQNGLAMTNGERLVRQDTDTQMATTDATNVMTVKNGAVWTCYPNPRTNNTFKTETDMRAAEENVPANACMVTNDMGTGDFPNPCTSEDRNANAATIECGGGQWQSCGEVHNVVMLPIVAIGHITVRPEVSTETDIGDPGEHLRYNVIKPNSKTTMVLYDRVSCDDCTNMAMSHSVASPFVTMTETTTTQATCAPPKASVVEFSNYGAANRAGPATWKVSCDGAAKTTIETWTDATPSVSTGMLRC